MKTIVDIGVIMPYYVCYEARCNRCKVKNICNLSTKYCPAVMVAEEICKILETGIYYG